MTAPQPGREPVDVKAILCDWFEFDDANADLRGRFPKLTYALELPAKWAPDTHPPVLLFENDGDPLVIWPVGTSETIRITSWTRGLDRRYIHAVLARVLSVRVPGIAKVLPGAGVVDARDPTTGGDLSSITVRTRARLAVPSPNLVEHTGP